ncbi:MAG: T9SS type A sorting domain-containing protein [Bacteroidales bacterium]|nr:T9SS type A sorting domain-containing protein [Bacteroidales bacterium]
MKKLLPVLFFSFIFSFWFAEKTQAQCTPDVGCVEDTVGNGKMCPDSLPDGYIGVAYDEVITVIPPDHATISGNDVTIDHLTLNSVIGLPPGLQYTPNDVDMYAPNHYCVLLDGTPTDTGFYQLEIHVEVFIDGGILGIIDAGEQVDDSSLSITIRDATVSIVENNQDFVVLGAQPNPFYGKTSIKYYSPDKEKVSLIVYDLLGNKIYDETMISRKGINKFNFSAHNLSKGIYCYSITAHNKTFTKRMIKTN